MKKEKSFVHYDLESDVLCIVTKEGEEDSFVEVAPGVNVELDGQGEVIGIEILHASKFLKPVAKPLYQQMQVSGVF
ncbi:MAG: DUF2283 domain-containing protein [Proteobacteria bacterium]|nr:DUF2283 domain-containing protein [Pseudomonadota bacterium]